MNELAREKSPYLLQHQNNPVNWKAWSEPTLKSARGGDKLIFLSIGYATCHWCHVMERESFENQSVAELLNQNFVCIKVDREEMPDVDQIYMDSLQAMGQRGGWPLNVFLTPDLKPFYGGTYFPRDQFTSLLRQLINLWSVDREKIILSSDQLRTFLHQQTLISNQVQLKVQETLAEFEIVSRQNFDGRWGGFGEAPKFPPNMQLALLLRLAQDKNDTSLLKIAEETLKGMAKGGLYDHIGGGFTRYSVDERWEIPHFEKMLYVNALSLNNFSEAFQITGHPDYKSVVEDTVQYLLRDMTSTGGAFFTAEDADSEGEEGRFYVYTRDELQSVLSSDELVWLEENMGLSEQGNFEHRATHLTLLKSDFWEKKSTDAFKTIREKLLNYRDQRERPLLDDKVLTSWNGLLIGALARAGRAFQNKGWVDAAEMAQAFLKGHLWKDGRLFRRYRDGVSHFQGTLDDYAYLISGLIDLYVATEDEAHLIWAKELQTLQDKLFWDNDRGGYFFTSELEKNLIIRMKDFADSALPNSNGVSAMNLLALSCLFCEPGYRERAQQIVDTCAELILRYPPAYSQILIAARALSVDYKELVVAEGPIPEPTWKQQLSQKFLPDLLTSIGSGPSTLPLRQGKVPVGKKTTFYICRNGACEAPLVGWSEALSRLTKP